MVDVCASSSEPDSRNKTERRAVDRLGLFVGISSFTSSVVGRAGDVGRAEADSAGVSQISAREAIVVVRVAS